MRWLLACVLLTGCDDRALEVSGKDLAMSVDFAALPLDFANNCAANPSCAGGTNGCIGACVSCPPGEMCCYQASSVGNEFRCVEPTASGLCPQLCYP